jgi:hypothetical protein
VSPGGADVVECRTDQRERSAFLKYKHVLLIRLYESRDFDAVREPREANMTPKDDGNGIAFEFTGMCTHGRLQRQSHR